MWDGEYIANHRAAQTLMNSLPSLNRRIARKDNPSLSAFESEYRACDVWVPSSSGIQIVQKLGVEEVKRQADFMILVEDMAAIASLKTNNSPYRSFTQPPFC